MERIFVTGANRGIGYGIVQHYLEHKADNHVFATCRNPESADDLNVLASKYPDRVTIIQLDLAKQSDIESAYHIISEKVEGLDVLINNAAMRFPDEQELFGAVKMDEFVHAMQINAVSPFMIVQTFFELLKAGDNPRIVNVTTGSLEPVEYNLPYNYCISKAALNMISRYFAVNFREHGIISIGLYPGWVQTEMGYSGGGQPLLTIEQSAGGIVDVVSDLTLDDTEHFIAYTGRKLSALRW